MVRVESTPSLCSGHDRIATVEVVRGAAALAVAWFHVTNANTDFPATPWLRASGTWGWLGVESFFVISGFVLPLAMHRSGYRLGDAGRFLMRRLVRLHPAYLASVAATLALLAVSSRSPGFDRPLPDAPQVLLHVVYLPRFFGYDWVNAVYWTLGIEVQFYLLLACSFPLLTHRAGGVRFAWLAGAAALSLLPPSDFLVFPYLVVFAIGAASFLVSSGLVPRLPGLAMLSALTLEAGFVHGLPVALVAAGTATLVSFRDRLVWGPVVGVGAVSYSLYLIHAPVGGRVVNLGARYAKGAAAEIVVMLMAMLVSLAAAFVLYRLIERPSLQVAARLKNARKVRLKPDATYLATG